MSYRLIYRDFTELTKLTAVVLGLFQSTLILFWSFIDTFAHVPLAPIPCGALETER